MGSKDAQSLATYTAEFLGTYLLVFTVGCNVIAGNPVWAVTSIACSLMVGIYMFGSVSGANFNPAVSFALAVAEKLEFGKVPLYMLSQLLAGVAAGLSYRMLFGQAFDLGPGEGFEWWQALACEALWAFVLCFVVLNVAATKKNEGKEYYGLAIGFVIIAGGEAAGPISGGCYNPAVAAGVAIASGAPSGFGYWAAYSAAELAGGALAALLFRYVVRRDEYGDAEAPGLAAKMASEFLGTFVLVFTVGLNVLGKSPAAVLSIAASLTAMIFALGDVSGAHFNPAVTAALLSSSQNRIKEGPINTRDAACYVFAQLAGGALGGLAYASMLRGQSFPLAPGAGYSWVQAGLAEFIFTAVLASTVLHVATARVGLTHYFGLAIGACVVVGGNAIGAVSGGSLNPGVSVGVALSDALFGSATTTNGIVVKASTIQDAIFGFLFYSAAEICGGAFAALTFAITRPDEFSS